MKKRILLFLSFLLPLLINAGNIRLSASVDKTEVGLNEYFTLTVTCTGEGIRRMPEPKLPSLLNFEVTGKSTSQSTQISIINGRMNQTRTFEYNYTILPKKLGKFTIPPATLKYKGNIYKTEPVEITVVKVVKRQSSPPKTQQQFAFPDLFQENRKSAPVHGDIFIKAVPSGTKVYQGQEVDITYKLYTKFPILNLQFTKIPSYQNFWVEKIFEAKQLNTGEEIYRGQKFSTAVLSKIALFPMHSGEYETEQEKLSCDIQTGDMFDLFGGSRRINLVSNPIKIKVLPLPSVKPADFSGGVGNFTLSVKNKKDTLKVGETGEMDIIIRGKGNLKFLSAPKISFPEGFNTYEPEVQDNIEFQGGMHGKKICKYLFVPQSSGEYKISPIHSSFFSPATGKYYTLKTSPIKIFVKQGPAINTGISNPLYEKQYNKDINYIKPDVNSLKNISPVRDIFVIMVYLIGTILIPISFAYKKHTLLLVKDRAYARRHRSKKEVRKRLRDMTKFLKEYKEEEFFGAASHTILKFIGDRYNLETYGMKTDEIKDALKEKAIPEKYVTKVLEILKVCDIIRYMPGSEKPDMKKVYQDVKEILNALA